MDDESVLDMYKKHTGYTSDAREIEVVPVKLAEFARSHGYV